jgi:hypothetical protein
MPHHNGSHISKWGKCEVIGQTKRHWKMDSVRVKRRTKFLWEESVRELYGGDYT